jgi:hypothetical protein
LATISDTKQGKNPLKIEVIDNRVKIEFSPDFKVDLPASALREAINDYIAKKEAIHPAIHISGDKGL